MNKATPNKAYKNAICVSVGLLIIFTTSIFVAKDFFGNQIKDLIDDSTLLKEYAFIYTAPATLIGVNSQGTLMLATPTRSALPTIQKRMGNNWWQDKTSNSTILIATKILASGREIKALSNIFMIGSSSQRSPCQHNQLPRLTSRLRGLSPTRSMPLLLGNLQ